MTMENSDNKLQKAKVESDYSYILSLEMRGGSAILKLLIVDKNGKAQSK